MLRKLVWIMIAVLNTLSAADVSYAGRWKLNPSKSSVASAAKTVEFGLRGSDGFTVKMVTLNAACEARFDGKDYPATGPTVPSGYTLAVRKVDGRTFEMIQKLNGRVLYTSTFQVSSDGKTLTEIDSANSVGEKAKAVYDRQ
jgi:hypothetical protein